MATSQSNREAFVCKQMRNLPPVVSEWQQTCKQPRCSHFCAGECCNPGRAEADAPCPFDGMELPLEDATPLPAGGDDRDGIVGLEENFYEPW